MIFDFNASVFEEAHFDTLKQILVLLGQEQHFVITQNLKDDYDKWVFEKEPFKSYFGKYELQDLSKKLQKKANITTLHKQFLTKIVIGNNENEVSPYNALRILKERSLLLVENKLNEKKFLKGICDKYTNHPKRKSIYVLIQKAFENEWIGTEGGGTGDMKKNLEYYVGSLQFQNIECYKLFMIFDNDKEKVNGTLANTQKKMIGFIKNVDKSENTNWETTDKIIWHIWHKRALENYAPLEQVFIKIYGLTNEQKEYLQNLQPSTLDFLKYDKSNTGLKEEKIKEKFPEIFEMNFSYQLLEKRCEHHKISFETNNGNVIEISEIEQILLKIAKII
ncbi:MAG: hypothetical protein EAZ85_02775 [Bacteroidetes bacterium]|nr:MAG: hypothetical protein EAZ85_02775 [Bacteroidota bacterium]